MYETLNLIAVWSPRIFFGIVFLSAVWIYVRIRRGNEPKKLTLHGLMIASVLFKLIYAALLTFGQYFVWKADPLSRLLLSDSLKNLPAAVTGGIGAFNGNLGYFLFYSWSHFWLGAIWSVILALVFWLILRVLQNHQKRFFYPSETEIGFIAALIVGWPDFIIFVPFVFLSVVIVSIYLLVFLREDYTTLGWPLLIAVVLTLAASHFFGAAIGLQNWRIY